VQLQFQLPLPLDFFTSARRCSYWVNDSAVGSGKSPKTIWWNFLLNLQQLRNLNAYFNNEIKIFPLNIDDKFRDKINSFSLRKISFKFFI